jgi:hypothetical protein
MVAAGDARQFQSAMEQWGLGVDLLQVRCVGFLLLQRVQDGPDQRLTIFG